MLDFSSLAQAVADQPPCGPDCEYEGDFLALSQAVAGKPEQQFGDTVIPAVEPEWRAVEQMATALLGRTKDLRVVAWLTLAVTQLYGLQGFAAGSELARQLCLQFWDEVHPHLVIDGDEDPYLRINALSAFSDGASGYSEGFGIMRALRSQLLVSQPLPVSVRDVEMTVARDAAAKYSDTQVHSILADAVSAGSESIATFERIKATVHDFSALLDERFGSGESPDFSALNNLVKLVGGAIARVRPSSFGESDQIADSTEAALANGATGQVVQLASGEIRSREDVKKSLQRVCDYLERHEPSNPAALFVRRAQAMLDRNFLDIMLELSPDSVQHLKMLTGAKLPGE